MFRRKKRIHYTGSRLYILPFFALGVSKKGRTQPPLYSWVLLKFQNQEFNVFSEKRRMVSESSRLSDVFINHRGPDVKQTLAIQLYDSLQQLGIRAFLDSQEKQLGESFPSTIERAIRSASVHIAIFSKGYADSPWCLAELVLMLESQVKIMPVFYGVKPSDLRHIETGAYAEAFIKYKEKGRYLEKLYEWKEALQSLSLIAGEECNREQCIAERVWEGSGWNTQHALETLRDKCLVEEGDYYLRMHNHLRDLGREMALELNPPHRLWRPQDLECLELGGFRNILTKTNLRCFHSIFYDSMNFQETFFLGQSDNYVEMSASLLWLKLEGNSIKQSMESIPSWIPLQSLQCLKIKGGPFKMLWKNLIQAPSQLKSLDIIDCKHLRSVSGISNLAKLVLLNIYQCPMIKELSLRHLSYLEKITIVDCKHLKNVSGISNLANLVLLNISQCSELEELTLGHLESLEWITIADCKHLKNMPGTSNLIKLVKLNISQCPELEELTLGHLESLERITIADCKHLKNVSATSNLVKLVELNISQCLELEELTLGHLKSLETVRIVDCKHLTNVSGTYLLRVKSL